MLYPVSCTLVVVIAVPSISQSVIVPVPGVVPLRAGMPPEGVRQIATRLSSSVLLNNGWPDDWLLAMFLSVTATGFSKPYTDGSFMRPVPQLAELMCRRMF